MAACTDCLNNCREIVSDQCVQYTGPDIPLLGICQGDQLSVFEAKIVTGILSALDGTGITPKDVTLENCVYLKSLFAGKSPSLNNLLQLLIDSNCSLNSAIVAIQEQLAAGEDGTVWDLSCLSGLPTTPTSDQILQALIFLVCQINALVIAFPATYVQLTDLTSLVTPIINQIISASQESGVPQQYTKMVPYISYEYYGPMSNFDAGGIGLQTLGFSKVYVCNGSNGTPDRRGRVSVGAVKNVPGGALDPAVDPAVDPNNPNWSLLDKAGENFHKLTINEIPSHSHIVNDPGHTHNLSFGNYINISDSGAGTNVPSLGSNPGPSLTLSNVASKSTTGITLQASGGGQGHITYQPSIAANFIMYLP